MARVEVRELHKSFDDNPILRGIDLRIDDGEFLVLVGPSGCGKSTLLRTIAGLEEPTSGEVWIGERRIDQLPPRDRDLAMVFQSYALYPHLTVRANLSFGLMVRKTPREEIDAKVEAAAEMLGLSDLLGRYPRQLSGGQRQRVAMGRALVRSPRAFLFDEPLSNLDASLRGEMRVELKRIHAQLKSTMIYVTHDQVEAMTLADRIVVLRSGEIMQIGSPAELFERPANRFVAGFLGSPSMNFLSARVSGGVAVGLGFTVPCAGVAEGLEVEVGIRPHDLSVVGDGRASIDASVDVIEPLGAEVLVHARVGAAPITAVVSPQEGRDLRPGTQLTLRVPPERVHFFDRTDDRRLVIDSGAAAAGAGGTPG